MKCLVISNLSLARRKLQLNYWILSIKLTLWTLLRFWRCWWLWFNRIFYKKRNFKRLKTIYWSIKKPLELSVILKTKYPNVESKGIYSLLLAKGWNAENKIYFENTQWLWGWGSEVQPIRLNLGEFGISFSNKFNFLLLSFWTSWHFPIELPGDAGCSSWLQFASQIPNFPSIMIPLLSTSVAHHLESNLPKTNYKKTLNKKHSVIL